MYFTLGPVHVLQLLWHARQVPPLLYNVHARLTLPAALFEIKCSLPWVLCMSCSCCGMPGRFLRCCTCRADTAGCQGAGIHLTTAMHCFTDSCQQITFMISDNLKGLSHELQSVAPGFILYFFDVPSNFQSH
jgi:hypothetical protein